MQLPAITISPPSSIADESASTSKQGKAGSKFVDTGIQTDDDGYASISSSLKSRLTHSVACQTHRRQMTKDVITAAIATQTEELLERRNTFPRVSQARAEAVIPGHRRGGTFRDKWEAWKGRRRHNEHDRHGQNRKNVGVQTEGYTGEGTVCPFPVANSVQVALFAGVRDIIVQTDDSYLRSARRLNALRTVRAKSLRIAVSPQVKQRLNKMVAAAEKPAGTK